MTPASFDSYCVRLITLPGLFSVFSFSYLSLSHDVSIVFAADPKTADVITAIETAVVLPIDAEEVIFPVADPRKVCCVVLFPRNPSSLCVSALFGT